MADPTAALTAAAKGLLYPSDTDSPFTPFLWPAGPATARDAVTLNAKPPANAKIEEVTPDAFFGELASEPGYPELRTALETAVSPLQILRIGEVRISIYLLGKTADGQWAGLKTLSVET